MSKSASDLGIKNAKVWHRGTFVESSVAISEGKIIEISKSAHERASRIIEGRNRFLIPGLVDLHVHTRDPGFTYKEDFYTATRAAALGGVTTIVDMPNLNPLPNTEMNFLSKMEDCKQKAVVDFNHWALPTKPEEISKIAKLGAVGFKFFMVLVKGDKPVYPYLPETAIVDYGEIMKTFEEIAKTGLPCVVHPLEPEIFREAQRDIKEVQGRRDVDAYLDAYSYKNSLTLTSSTASLVLIASATGVTLEVAHVCWKEQLELARALKMSGFKFKTEINPWALFLTREDNKRLGPFSHGLYHEGKEQDSIYEFLKDGTIDIIATDHAPHTREEIREKGTKDYFESPKGTPVLQDYLRLFLDAINKNKLGLEAFVRLASENPARHAGIYPRKGAIEVGSDADLVLVDMKKRYVISNDKVESKAGWTPWDGRETIGSQETVIVRGEIVAQDYDVLVGKKGFGEFVKPSGR
ncbi:MAG: dihydroorotase [Nitrososphaerales archaeon]